MAFYRVNMNITPLMNHVYCKLCIRSIKPSVPKRHASIKSRSQQSLENNDTLNGFIKDRKKEALKSIIVEVESWKSCKDVVTYCSFYGDISKVYYYVLPQDHQYLLLEFRDEKQAQNVLHKATYLSEDNVFPSRTNVVWFRNKLVTGDATIRKRTSYIPVINSPAYIRLNHNNIQSNLQKSDSISNQMTLLQKEYKISELETRLKFQTISQLEQCFTGLFPYILIQPFGSFMSGFGERLSDLDLITFTDGLRKEDKSSPLVFHAKSVDPFEMIHREPVLALFSESMKYIVPGVCNIRKIFNARVPIIKFNYVYTYTECDMSVSNVNAMMMTELLFIYGKLDDRVIPLVVTIRKWARTAELTSTTPGPTVTNFSLTLMIIFFLQQKKILPSITELSSSLAHEEFLVSPYLTSLSNLPRKTTNTDNLETLLVDFFIFYSTFDFAKNKICLQSGNILDEHHESALFINNPFDKSLNVSRNVNILQCRRIQMFMIRAIDKLENSDKSKIENWGLLSIITSLENAPLKRKKEKFNVTGPTVLCETLQEHHAINNLV